MQGKKDHSSKLYYNVTLEKLVPTNHIIRKIDEALDLDFLYKDTEQFYSHEGKPSIDPVVLFKIYIIGYFFGISSERQLFRDIQVNLAYRWYLGYDIDEEIPDHSIMTKSRNRFPRDVFENLFKRIINECKKQGLISGDYYFLDSSLIRANTSKESYRAKLKNTCDYLADIQATEEKAVQFSGTVFDGIPNPEKMGKRRNRLKKNNTFESQTDKDAEIITRPGKGSFPSYKAHVCVDRKRRVITAIDGSKASDDDMSKIHDLYTASLFVVGKKPMMITADSHYGGVESLKYFQDQNIETCIPPRIPDNLQGKYKNTDFQIVNDGKNLSCPAGHLSTQRMNHKYRIQYAWSKTTCNACAIKEKCTNSENGRLVSFYQGSYFLNAIALTKSEKGRKLLRARQIIVEGVIGEAKMWHLLGRCKYRGLEKLKIQLFMTASVINLKRLVQWGHTKVNKPVKALRKMTCEFDPHFFMLFITRHSPIG